MKSLKKMFSILIVALSILGLSLAFQNCGPNYRFSSSDSILKESDTDLAIREPSSDEPSSSNTANNSNSSSDGVMLCNGKTCQPSAVPAAPSLPANSLPSPSAPPSSSSVPSLAFVSLGGVPINSGAFFSQGSAPLVSSNQITLQSLPAEGALLSFEDDPTMSEEFNTCQFAFNINDESEFYCHVKKDRKVFNGDRLRFVAIPSRYWSKKMNMHYQIGSLFKGVWSVETIADPGTKVQPSGRFGFELAYAQPEKVIYSNTVTISGLASTVRGVPVQVFGWQDGFELSINGEWMSASTKLPTYGIWVKNGDQLQFRIIPRQSNTIYRAKILFEKIGLRNGTFNYTQSDYIEWSISTDTANSTTPSKSFCEAGVYNGMASVDGTQNCDFSWQAAEVGASAKFNIKGANATFNATCTENGKNWTYNFHCPGTLKKSCYGGQIANIPSKSKANTFCMFSWGMTEVGKAAGINATNGGSASGYVCQNDGSYSVGSFNCP